MPIGPCFTPTGRTRVQTSRAFLSPIQSPPEVYAQRGYRSWDEARLTQGLDAEHARFPPEHGQPQAVSRLHSPKIVWLLPQRVLQAASEEGLCLVDNLHTHSILARNYEDGVKSASLSPVLVLYFSYHYRRFLWLEFQYLPQSWWLYFHSPSRLSIISENPARTKKERGGRMLSLGLDLESYSHSHACSVCSKCVSMKQQGIRNMPTLIPECRETVQAPSSW